MDLELLLHRCSLAPAPISLLVRPNDSSLLPTILERALALLRGRHLADEIIILLGELPSEKVSVPALPIRWRLVVHKDAKSGPALAKAFLISRHPAIVLTDPEVSITPTELDDLLESLEECDLVVGRRRNACPWWRWPAELLLRRLFSVPFLDPLCPIKAIRRSAIRGVPLQTPAPLVELEIIAKMTYLTSVMDEVLLPDRTADSNLLGVCCENRKSLWELFVRPRFWHFDPRVPRFRLPPFAEPAPQEPSVRSLTPLPRLHPIETKWGPRTECGLRNADCGLRIADCGMRRWHPAKWLEKNDE